MKKCTIPNPCDKNWDNMSSTQKGAFCGFCQTEVFDLTQAEPEEIIDYFKRAAKKKTCVKIPKSKLESANTINWYNGISIRKQVNYLFVLAVAMTFSINASATHIETEEDPIIMGGILMPFLDSAGYYPATLDFNDFFPEEAAEITKAPVFKLILKGDTVEVEYKSPRSTEIKYHAYTLEYDSISQSYITDTIISDTKVIIQGKQNFFIKLDINGSQTINVQIEINGVIRYGTLYPRNHFSDYPSWMY